MDDSRTRPTVLDITACGQPVRRPFVRIAGARGSSIRASRGELVVCRCGDWTSGTQAGGRSACRRWPYDALADIRLDGYGPLGVVRATLRQTGADLPLLLVEPDQVPPARRALELVENLMAVHQEARHTA